MKKLIIAAVGLLLLSAAISCKKDWLNPAPEDTLIPSDSTFVQNANAERFVNAAYAQMNDWGQSVFSWIGMSSITSDDADKGSDPGDLGADKDQMDNFSYTPTSLSPSEVWSANFTGLARANVAIENVPKFTTLDDATRDRLIGEAKFLRAFYYFNLVRCFGDVPLIDHVLDADNSADLELSYRRVPKNEVYAFIIADLQDAAAKLPAKAAQEPGRAHKGSAQGMLAKVLLYTKDWSGAVAAAESVMAAGYDLEPDYATIWRQSTENGIESLFEVQAQNGGEGWATGGYFPCQGARGTVTNGWGGWGFNTPSTDLEAAYEPGDVRKAGTIYYAGQTLWDGAIVADNVANPRYNYKAYASQTQESNYSDWWSSKNIRILRFGEILLIHAEAANELGDVAKAQSSLNRVRARAGLANTTASSQSELRDAIWRERRVELAMEHDRFFDLVRQGRAGQVLRAHGKNFVDGKHEVFPIPQNQINISGGRLTQNPGY